MPTQEYSTTSELEMSIRKFCWLKVHQNNAFKYFWTLQARKSKAKQYSKALEKTQAQRNSDDTMLVERVDDQSKWNIEIRAYFTLKSARDSYCTFHFTMRNMTSGRWSTLWQTSTTSKGYWGSHLFSCYQNQLLVCSFGSIDTSFNLKMASWIGTLTLHNCMREVYSCDGEYVRLIIRCFLKCVADVQEYQNTLQIKFLRLLSLSMTNSLTFNTKVIYPHFAKHMLPPYLLSNVCVRWNHFIIYYKIDAIPSGFLVWTWCACKFPQHCVLLHYFFSLQLDYHREEWTWNRTASTCIFCHTSGHHEPDNCCCIVLGEMCIDWKSFCSRILLDPWEKLRMGASMFERMVRMVLYK